VNSLSNIAALRLGFGPREGITGVCVVCCLDS